MTKNNNENLAEHLKPTEFIECEAPAIVEMAQKAVSGVSDPAEMARRLFYAVRDQVRYNPYQRFLDREIYRATKVLENGHGYCVQKAILLASLARAVGIPTRLAFADVRNHQMTEKLRQQMGTNLFIYHGYVEFFLNGNWVKATPAFDQGLVDRQDILPVEFDGKNDATLHPVDPHGAQHIEYVEFRGAFADLPFDDLVKAFVETYAPTMETHGVWKDLISPE